MPAAVRVVLTIALATVLVVSALAKARRPTMTTASLRAFGVPAGLAPVAARLLPAAEFVVALLLILARGSAVGALAATGLLLVFTVAVGASLLAGRRPPCACFGAASVEPISGRTLIRNAVLLAMAVLAIP